MLNSFYRLTLSCGIFFIDGTALIYDNEKFCLPTLSKYIIIGDKKWRIISVEYLRYSPHEADKIRQSPDYLGEKDFIGKFTYHRLYPNAIHIKNAIK